MQTNMVRSLPTLEVGAVPLRALGGDSIVASLCLLGTKGEGEEEDFYGKYGKGEMFTF